MGTSVPSNVTIIQTCVTIPPNVRSDGLWKSNFYDVTSHPLTKLQMQLAMIFVVTQAVYYTLKLFGLKNAVVAQMIAGMIMGPNVLGRIPQYVNYLIPYHSQEILGMVTMLGHIIFLFLIGVKMDPGIVLGSGKKALYTGFSCLLTPFIVSLAFEKILTSYMDLNERDNIYLIFTTATHSLSTFPVISVLLSDLKILTSELGRLALGSSLVADMFGLSLELIAKFGSVAMERDSYKDAIRGLSLFFAFLFGVLFVFRPAMFWIIRRTPEGQPVKDVYIFTIFLVALGTGLMSQLYEMTLFFGPFIFGLAVPNGPPLGTTLVHKFDFFTTKVWLPPYVTTCVMRANFDEIKFRSPVAKAHALVLFVIILSKFAGSFIPTLFWRMPLKDALALALILSNKGVVELALYSLSRDSQGSNDELYAYVIITVLLTALIVPILVKNLYDPSRKYAGYQQRNIMHAKPNAELKILACVNSADNIPALIRLLNSLSPTKQNPISVYVLHLIEMVGRAFPIFISHQMQKRSTSTYSDNVILSFRNFEKEYPEAVNVNVFTAISPHKYLHEDVCTLALDKLISIIILPFHRKWSIDGLIQSEDNTIRTLNCSVLDRAPCSVGILVNRGGSHYAVLDGLTRAAVIFLGGSDDREALAFARHMAKDDGIILTVFHLITEDHEDEMTDWDKMVDMQAFREMKHKNDNISIYQERVKDGHETAEKLREVAHDFDLFLVGRRHNKETPQTSGLDDWSEFPELGILGDMLASMDFNTRSSVLVVQQQKKTYETSKKSV